MGYQIEPEAPSAVKQEPVRPVVKTERKTASAAGEISGGKSDTVQEVLTDDL